MQSDKKEKNSLQNWSDSTLRLAINTEFKCEYCKSDFFASVESYYAFEVEHIVPRGRGPEIDEAPENLTVACRTCNRLKRRWDPRSKVKEGDLATREQLIDAAREYVTVNPPAYFPSNAPYLKLLPRQITHGSNGDGRTKEGQGIKAQPA